MGNPEMAISWVLRCLAALTIVSAIPLPLQTKDGSLDLTKSKNFLHDTGTTKPPGPLQHEAPIGKLESISLSSGGGIKGFRRFVDEHGRERIFHGINVVVKGPPWIPSTDKFDANTSLVAEDLVFLKSLGVNVIRLGVMWAGAEPEKGVYNYTYLGALKVMAAQAAQYGIYTLLDMHQDVVSSFYRRSAKCRSKYERIFSLHHYFFSCFCRCSQKFVWVSHMPTWDVCSSRTNSAVKGCQHGLRSHPVL
jgi:hypothetical protein